MEVTKVGHSCVVVHQGGTAIMVDPGRYTDKAAIFSGPPLSALIYTHKHGDHLEESRLRLLLAAYPDLPIYTNEETARKLDELELGVSPHLLVDGGVTQVGSISLRSWERRHHPIHPSVDGGSEHDVRAMNLSLLFEDKFLHPGDRLFVPPEPCQRRLPLLAIPFAPFVSIAECIDYGLKMQPKRVLPVHDGYFSEPGPYERVPLTAWEETGIQFTWIPNGGRVQV